MIIREIEEAHKVIFLLKLDPIIIPINIINENNEIVLSNLLFMCLIFKLLIIIKLIISIISINNNNHYHLLTNKLH